MAGAVDQNYFDFQRGPEERLRKMFYVFGAFYPCYLPLTGKHQGVIRFRSRHKELVELVRDELQSTNNLQHLKTGNAYFINIGGAPDLMHRLSDLGLRGYGEEREFPDYLPANFRHDFARGTLDGAARITARQGVLEISIAMAHREKFVAGLHSLLTQIAEVSRGPPPGDYIHYSNEDSIKIWNALYKDERLLSERLALPSNWSLMNDNNDLRTGSATYKMQRRIDKGKKLLLEGKSTLKIAEELGYSNVQSFYGAFKKVTGTSPEEFLRIQKEKEARPKQDSSFAVLSSIFQRIDSMRQQGAVKRYF